MKVTQELRKAINQAVRRKVGGVSPLVEVGVRMDGERLPSNNALAWPDEEDLFEIRRLAAVKEINDDPRFPGRAELDCYVTTGTGWCRELETNVSVFIEGGQVVGAAEHYREIAAWHERWQVA